MPKLSAKLINEAALSNELSSLLNRMTPRMTDEGFEQFKRTLNNALSQEVDKAFEAYELEAFHVDLDKLVHLKRD